MKQGYLFFITLFFTVIISVQRIARVNTNPAIADNNLSFTFNITKADNTALYAENQTIRAPDLKGMFLRGSGRSGVSGYTKYKASSVLNPQRDSITSHDHAATISMSSVGNHAHAITKLPLGRQWNVNRDTETLKPSNGCVEDWAAVSYSLIATNTTGNHIHGATVDAGSTSLDENRPDNVGATYSTSSFFKLQS